MIERRDNYKIHSYDTDMNQRLAIPTLTRFLQETAWLNAEDMGFGYQEFLKSNMAWVLFKQYIKLEKVPVWGDEITLRTWPSLSDKLFCYREFEIYNKKELIGGVSTSWLVIDLKSRRPLRTSRYYNKNININETILFPEIVMKKLKPSLVYSDIFTHKVRITDIDINQHVNNSCYTQWCLNYYDMDFYKAHRITEIEQQFSAEARLGDSLDICTDMLDEFTYSHTIQRDGKDIFFLNIKWEQY